MTIFVAILGLGVLIFVHELGHFVASLALGMRPRRFYIGFPPAIWKTTRNGIEYGIGAIPLGGFVKIPGMHRPAPVDVDAGLRPGARGGTLARRPDRAAPRRARGGRSRRGAGLAPRAARARSTERELVAAGRARRRAGPRRPRRRARPGRVLARARRGSGSSRSPPGPAAEHPARARALHGLFMTSVGKATTTVDEVSQDSPAGPPGCSAGDRIVSIDGRPSQADDISRVISGSDGKPLTVVVVRDGERVTLPATAPATERRRLPARVHPARARGCRCPRRRRSRSASAGA